jgi:hypothetical protein
MNFEAEIQGCKWLFMNSISEPSDNELRLQIFEAVSLPASPDTFRPLNEALDLNLPLGSPIEHVSGYKIFTLQWPSYVAYSVRNESYTTVDKYEIFEGRNFVKYSKSRYLDFVRDATFADDSFPGPMTHWGIFCLNHIIDVVSCHQPEVSISVEN